MNSTKLTILTAILLSLVLTGGIYFVYLSWNEVAMESQEFPDSQNVESDSSENESDSFTPLSEEVRQAEVQKFENIEVTPMSEDELQTQIDKFESSEVTPMSEEQRAAALERFNQ